MEHILKIILALVLGGVLGAERSHAGKPAGLRTYILVTLASTVFTIVSYEANSFFASPVYDPGRIMSQVLLGIGFIGAGIVIHQKEHIQGLTTAAGLWLATSIGMLIGIEQYLLAIIISLLTFLILISSLFTENESKES